MGLGQNFNPKSGPKNNFLSSNQLQELLSLTLKLQDEERWFNENWFTCNIYCLYYHHRWHRDGLHYRDLRWIPNRKDSALSHSCCHMSGLIDNFPFWIYLIVEYNTYYNRKMLYFKSLDCHLCIELMPLFQHLFTEKKNLKGNDLKNYVYNCLMGWINFYEIYVYEAILAC